MVLASTEYHFPSHSASEVKLYVGKSPYHSVSSCRAVGSQMPQNRSSIKIRPAFSFPGGTNDQAKPMAAPRKAIVAEAAGIVRLSRTAPRGGRAPDPEQAAGPIGRNARAQEEEARDPGRRKEVQGGLAGAARKDVVVLEVAASSTTYRAIATSNVAARPTIERRSSRGVHEPAARQAMRARRAGTAECELFHRRHDRDEAFGMIDQQQPSLGSGAIADQVQHDRGERRRGGESRSVFLPRGDGAGRR